MGLSDQVRFNGLSTVSDTIVIDGLFTLSMILYMCIYQFYCMYSNSLYVYYLYLVSFRQVLMLRQFPGQHHIQCLNFDPQGQYIGNHL